MNRIRKAGKQEGLESRNHESRKSKQFQRLLVSWVPNLLLIFSCVSAFLIDSSSAADVVIGSKKFTESYVLGEIAKRTLAEAGIPAEHRQGMGGTDHTLGSASGRADRRVSGIYGNNRNRNSKERFERVAESNPGFARKTWRRHDSSTGLQQYIRAGNATQRSATAWYPHNQRSTRTSRV